MKSRPDSERLGFPLKICGQRVVVLYQMQNFLLQRRSFGDVAVEVLGLGVVGEAEAGDEVFIVELEVEIIIPAGGDAEENGVGGFGEQKIFDAHFAFTGEAGPVHFEAFRGFR